MNLLTNHNFETDSKKTFFFRAINRRERGGSDGGGDDDESCEGADAETHRRHRSPLSPSAQQIYSNYVVFMGVLLIISAVLAYMQMFKR